MNSAGRSPILHAPGGLSFLVGGQEIGIEPLTLYPGQWIVLTPDREDLGPDLATAAARLFATLQSPHSGAIELFGKATQSLDYMGLLHLRSRLGFVQGHGGLLSNRSLQDNIALPLSVHGNVTHDEEVARVAEILARFDLDRVAALRPHEVDGITRFRACVARALALSPGWLVLEGIGAFEAETSASTTWRRLMDYMAGQTSAAVICLARPRPAFERWFADQGGKVVPYRLFTESSLGAERNRVS